MDGSIAGRPVDQVPFQETNRHGDAAAPFRPPVFLHCGWRTRGTWLWNRFRTAPGITGYYEPLSEALGSVRRTTLAQHNA